MFDKNSRTWASCMLVTAVAVVELVLSIWKVVRLCNAPQRRSYGIDESIMMQL